MPRPTSFKLISPPYLLIETTISKLIDDDNQWKVALIYQHFMKEDADMITRIPLRSKPMENQVLWYYDKKKKGL